MNVPPPFPVDGPEVQRRKDDEHIRLLGIFHFVGAGLAVLGLGFLILHYEIMSHVFNNPDMWKGQKNAPPAALFDFFIWFYAAGAVFLLVCATINLLSGLFLLKRRHRMFSLVVGGINCIHVPFGTALGVFTIIVLSRDSVRDSYPQ